jgi:hypothetical protein
MMRNHKKWNDPVANAKYYGKTAETIEQMWAIAGRDAAAAGTAMHYKIERFFNTSPEHQQRSANRIQILSQLPERGWKSIRGLYLIVLHPEAQNYQSVDLPDFQSEIAELFQERLHHFTAVAATATAAERK